MWRHWREAGASVDERLRVIVAGRIVKFCSVVAVQSLSVSSGSLHNLCIMNTVVSGSERVYITLYVGDETRWKQWFQYALWCESASANLAAGCQFPGLYNVIVFSWRLRFVCNVCVSASCGLLVGFLCVQLSFVWTKLSDWLGDLLWKTAVSQVLVFIPVHSLVWCYNIYWYIPTVTPGYTVLG